MIRASLSFWISYEKSFQMLGLYLEGFNYNVEEWFEGGHYETLAICRTLALARFAFKLAIAEKPGGRFMIRSRPRVVKRHPEGDW